MMRCQRCGEREAEIFQTQRLGDKLYDRSLLPSRKTPQKGETK